MKKFIGNLFFLIFINVLVKPFWLFGVEREVQNTVGAEDYGIYFALFNFSFIFQIILDFGIQNYNNRLIAQHEQLLQKYLPNILVIKTLLAIVYMVFTFATAFALQFSAFHFKLLTLLAASQILISLTLYLRSNISGMHLFRTDAILSVLDKILMIFIIGGLLVLSQHQFEIEWLVYGQTIAYLITAAAALAVVFTKTGKLTFKLQLPLMLVILKQSFPYALIVFLMTLYIRLDAVMLERMLEDGAYQAGIYAAGYRILDAVNMIGFLFATILLPMFSRQLQQKKSISDLTTLAFKLLFTVALIICIPCFFFSAPIVDLLYDQANVLMAKTFGILILTFLGVSTMYIFGTLLVSNGTVWPLNRSFILFVIGNVALNLILIPKYGAYGAAIATLCTQGAVAVVEIWLTKKHMDYQPALGLFFRLALFACLIIVTGFLLRDVLVGNTIPAFLITAFLATAVAFVIKLFRPQDLLNEIQRDTKH